MNYWDKRKLAPKGSNSSLSALAKIWLWQNKIKLKKRSLPCITRKTIHDIHGIQNSHNGNNKDAKILCYRYAKKIMQEISFNHFRNLSGWISPSDIRLHTYNYGMKQPKQAAPECKNTEPGYRSCTWGNITSFLTNPFPSPEKYFGIF